MDGKGASKDWTEENITRVALFFYEIEVAGRLSNSKGVNGNQKESFSVTFSLALITCV